ncbi:isovaleryl-CoA dehydrogenase [Rhizobacter sp. Root404]|uniref:isovaleryl-CoA dehydrogenase n=1 Tax=Rhizobacter sp. Root404 TaxID=1736528 RepID=UPI0006F7A48B|nr:isovaleryl-CoA dehydrogenase [Rhizobacter sp. Root404]KQW36905.1 DNA alkylation response protein [Rhizobacter sp. Root404]
MNPTATHEVLNQSEPLAGHNLYTTDRALRDALRFHAPQVDEARRTELGLLLGDPAMQAHARLANVHKPSLHTYDRYGHRTDTVEFHPSYHALLGAAVGAGLHATPWAQPGPGAHIERAAGFLMYTQLEPSVLCPVSMTYAVTPALRDNGAVFTDWFDKLASTAYDPRLLHVREKRGVTMGMGMTEKQGGSDVRANTTRAEYIEDTPWGRCYRLVGHKWFFSAPMSDAFLVLAQTPAGLSCFFLPRVLPDGRLNAIAIQRLKDKLGNHANASSEVEFNGALAWLVGEEGRGVPQILEMGTLTRLDCALGTAGLMRGAVALALHHASQRHAFGKPLIEQPLMKNVLADLALESEAATALALRLARAIDRQDDPFEALMRRVLTPVAKFWVCKRGSALAQEAMECLGGNGYVEEHGEGTMARIYREMPLNSIWEGAGNIMALDLLRAMKKRDANGDDVVGALATELDTARGAHPGYDHFTAALLARFNDAADGGGDEAGARRLAQDIALAVQASLLQRHSPAAVFDAFCRSRLGGDGPLVFGTLPAGVDVDSIIRRALPC